MTSIETISGSGSFKNASLISFSYSEDATPISPSDLSGGTGQISAQLVSNESTRGSRIAINNEALLSDEEYGDINFTVKKVSLNDGLVSITGDSVQSRLDVERTAMPQGSDAGGYTLGAAIEYYCSLAGVTPNFETGLQTKLDAIDVDFIGWQGNVWEYLKMLCAVSTIDSNAGSFIEMYVINDELWFREGASSTLDTSGLISSEVVEIDAYDAAQTINIIKYDTDYRANSLVRQDNIDELFYANLENVSIVDSFQVQANEKITRRVTINASLESVEQPIPVETVAFPVTYGQYVIVGKDEIPLTPAQWVSQGGALTVSLTENPNEIEISIVGANYPELEPFKIGVESAGGDNYPALYIRGTGVFFEKSENVFYTGAPETDEITATTIDNPFITSNEVLLNAGLRAAQEVCGPSFKLKQEVPRGLSYGTTTGSIVFAYDSKFRIDKTSFTHTGVSIEGSSYVTFADFDSVWSGDTFADFTAAMTDISFNEFSVIALVKE